MAGYDLIIVMPVYNDWISFYSVTDEIRSLYAANKRILILAVNDGGEKNSNDIRDLEPGLHIGILNLFRNLGHQKAIAIGLTYATSNFDFESVIVMDCDGEDKPADIQVLLDNSNSNKVLFAKRTKRKEGLVFRFFYSVYKRIFKILTGTDISFGNFCLLKKEMAGKITYVSETWSHFSGGIVKSKVPYDLLPLERGKRIDGKSKMNFQSLVLHGLSSISVHIETVSVRILLSSMVLLLSSVFAISVVVYVKLFTNLAVPGWTSNMVIALILIFLVSLVLSLLLIFIILNSRGQKNFIPALESQIFISSIETNYDTGG